jgi:hypothetical protein
MGIKDIIKVLTVKHKIMFSFTYLVSLGLLVTSTNEPLGFHLFGFILSVFGILLTFFNSYRISQKLMLRRKLEAGVISEELFKEKISVNNEIFPVNDNSHSKILICIWLTIQIIIFAFITLLFVARVLTWIPNNDLAFDSFPEACSSWSLANGCTRIQFLKDKCVRPENLNGTSIVYDIS